MRVDTPNDQSTTLPGPPVLAIRGLRKVFGVNVAVENLSLDVPTGSFFGLLGPNGAGKTTTLSMATGLLRPDAGHVWISGHDVWADPLAAKRSVGVLAETPNLFERLSGRQLLVYTGLLRGMSEAVVQARADDLLGVTGLHDAADVMVVDYSQGMRKKIGLAAALLHTPPLLLLDEPFESVDPVSARTLRGVLDRYRAGGGTVVFSSHVMELVERLCDHVAVIAAGRVVAAGPISQVTQGRSMEDTFVQLVGGTPTEMKGLEWLDSSSS